MVLEEIVKYQTVGIIGTDTEVGKTYVTVKLLQQLNSAGFLSCGLKPIASGAFLKGNQWVNEDALAIQQSASVKLDYKLINPVVYQPAIAPHIAASEINDDLNVAKVTKLIQSTLAQVNADITLIEGAGGLLTPLNHQQGYDEVFKALNIPVIMVVGMKLGCINHALLTAKSLQQSDIPCIGWIANCIDPDMQVLSENVQTLKKMLSVKFLGSYEFEVLLDNVIC
ncbi:dethiobiotin synthase [Facilibium subflavum]|uniref:dethiobiotin synthase n=1 Tax=Facilibium subflavum TaxID=2219058 RepID=UPI000E65C06B|nr:dethiobiotin synthase [Facilibium subflavum]